MLASLRSIRIKNIKNMPDGLYLFFFLAFAQGISFLSSPILARLFSPENFGIFANYMAVMAIAGGITSLRLDSLIISRKSEEDILHIHNVCSKIVLVSSLLITLLAFVYFVLILPIPVRSVASFIPYIFLSSVGFGLITIANAYLTRTNNIRRLASLRLWQSLVALTLQIILGIIAISNTGLIIGMTVSSLFLSIVYNLSIWRKSSHTSFSDIKFTISNNFQRVRSSSVATLLNILANQAPLIMISLSHSIELAGFYTFAMRIVSAPLELLGRSQASVLIGSISQHPQNISLVRREVLLFLRPFAVILVLSICIFPFIGGIFVSLFGSTWDKSIIIAKILLFPLIVFYIGSSLSGILDIYNRYDLQLRREVFRYIILFIMIPFLFFFPGSVMLFTAIYYFMAGILNTIFSFTAINQSLSSHETR